MANEPIGIKLVQDLMATGPTMVLKWFIVIGLVFYTFFALITVRQVGIMSETFESEVNGTVKTFAWLHFLISVFLIVIAVIVL